MPTTAFDWNQIQDIAIQFGPFNAKDNAHKYEDFNKSFAHDLEYTDGLFITDDDAEGPKTLALDPVTLLREIIVTAIMNILSPKERTAINKGHISRLFADATFWYVDPNQSVRRLRNKNAMDKAGEQAISNGQDTILIEIRASHWGFKPDWDAIHFGEIYDTNIYRFPEATQDRYGKSNIRDATTVVDKTADASRARFANLLQRKYIKPSVHLQRKHIKRKHRTKPTAPVVSDPLPVTSHSTNVPSGTTGLVQTKTTVRSLVLVLPRSLPTWTPFSQLVQLPILPPSQLPVTSGPGLMLQAVNRSPSAESNLTPSPSNVPLPLVRPSSTTTSPP